MIQNIITTADSTLIVSWIADQLPVYARFFISKNCIHTDKNANPTLTNIVLLT